MYVYVCMYVVYLYLCESKKSCYFNLNVQYNTVCHFTPTNANDPLPNMIQTCIHSWYRDLYGYTGSIILILLKEPCTLGGVSTIWGDMGSFMVQKSDCVYIN